MLRVCPNFVPIITSFTWVNDYSLVVSTDKFKKNNYSHFTVTCDELITETDQCTTDHTINDNDEIIKFHSRKILKT